MPVLLVKPDLTPDIGFTGLSSLGAGMELVMAIWNEPRGTGQGFGASPRQAGSLAGGITFDAGLRKHMLSIYNYMASGVLLSGLIAMLFANSGYVGPVMGSGLGIVLMLAPLGVVLAMSFGANRFSTGTLQMLFWGFAVLMGLSLSTIFLVYTGASIAATFFATAGAFAGLSLYGYTTQKDISGWGSFLIMGVIGILIASVINIFLKSPALYYAVGVIGVLVFAGLTAYDTQRLKEEYRYVAGTEMAGKAAPIFKEYGATRVVECWGDDVPHGKVTDFFMAVKAEEGETVVFSWIEWPSKEVRDAGMAKVMADERMKPGPDLPFEGKRMIYGGFAPILTA